MSKNHAVTQASLQMTGKQHVDEHGELDRWNRGGVYNAAGEFDRDATVTLLEERFGDVREDIPTDVNNFSRCVPRHVRKDEAEVWWVRNGFPRTEEMGRFSVKTRTVHLFPRGPYLHDWSVGVQQLDHGGRRGGEESGTCSFLHASGLETPREALESAVEYMEAFNEQ